MLRAIAAAKKKNDRVDASKICDCLRCDFLPECYMASAAIRERRRAKTYHGSRETGKVRCSANLGGNGVNQELSDSGIESEG